MTEETNIRSWPRRPAGRARLAIVALTCSGAALIAGCSSSSTSNASGAGKAHKAAAPVASQSPSGAASGMPKAAVCVHINALRTSLTSLTHIKVTATTASQLTTDLGNIQSHLTAIKGQNLGAFSHQADILTAELNKIKADSAKLSSSPTTAATALTKDLATLKTKAGPMIVEMKKVCHVSKP